MTQAEFNRWWADLAMRFPNVDGWLVRVAPEQGSQRNMLRSWADVLRDVTVADCLEINRQMQCGDQPFVEDFHEQDIPAHVRRLARQLAFENRTHGDGDRDAERKPSHFPAGKIYKRIVELTDKGATPDEAKEIALREFPVGRPSWEPRYRCDVCLDVGMVVVASPTAIRAMLNEEFHKCIHREAAMLCHCRSHIQQNPRRPRCVYDPSEDFKVADPIWKASEVDRFRDWVESKRAAYWESKREPAFDRWNREFAP